MYAAGSSRTGWKRRYAGIDVMNVMMKSAPKIRAFLWSAAIPPSFVASFGVSRDDAIPNTKIQGEVMCSACFRIRRMIVYAVVDDALSPEFPSWSYQRLNRSTRASSASLALSHSSDDTTSGRAITASLRTRPLG
jgi:hypothetical protein